MRNYLIAIDNEIKNYYEKFIVNYKENLDISINEFIENTMATLDFYVEPIFNNGINLICKQLGVTPNNHDEFIQDYKLNKMKKLEQTLNNGFLNYFEEIQDDKEFYNKIMEVIFTYNIRLFRTSQLIACKDNDITTVNLISDINLSCPTCQTLSKFEQNVDYLLNNINKLHVFCKLNIVINGCKNENMKTNTCEFINIPKNLINLVKPLLTSISISVPQLITKKTFEFVNNINDEENFNNILKEHYEDDKIDKLKDLLDDKIICYEDIDKVFVSGKHIDQLNYIIIKHLIKDKLFEKDLSWWKEQFYDKQKHKYVGDETYVYAKPFINFISEQNYKSYFIESAVAYILYPKYLKIIDEDNYIRLKNEIFNNMEFLKEQ